MLIKDKENIYALVNEAIALNEADESLFVGLGIRYGLKSSKPLKELKKIINSSEINLKK